MSMKETLLQMSYNDLLGENKKLVDFIKEIQAQAAMYENGIFLYQQCSEILREFDYEEE